MKRLLSIALVALAASAATFAPADDLGLRHFELLKSAPEKDAHLHQAPSEIRLWFSQEPQEGSTSIRLIDAAGNAATTGEVVKSADDGKVFSVAVTGTLAAGTYTVSWRALGQDGHVVRDTFSFMVMGH